LIPNMPWLNTGDTAWQVTAATLVGLMSVPGLAVLYGGVMQKRWSVNAMMMTFTAFSLTLIVWVLWAFDMGFGNPWHGISHGTTGFGDFFANFVGQPGSVLGHAAEEGQANIPLLDGYMPKFAFPTSALVYFQFVFAAITPILALGSVLGRINFKAWLIFVPLFITCIYSVNAFLLWGGGFFGAHGAVDFSGGYVIHLDAGICGFVAAWMIGPRLARDREIDAPNNLLMVAVGAGLLWLGWNGFNGGDPYFSGADMSGAVLNTNLCAAVALMVWVLWDFLTKRKPSLLGAVNGMIVGLVGITPAAGYVNGYGAIIIGVVATTIVYFAYYYLSRVPPFSRVDDTLGVIYTHGIAGLAGGLLTGVLADSNMVEYFSRTGSSAGVTGSLHLLKWQFFAALWVIIFTAIATFILLKFVSLIVPLRMSDADMEDGDLAVHGHEVYPSDIPSLGFAGSLSTRSVAASAPPPPPPPSSPPEGGGY
jgi:Amt family ammonium transporter